ncbi:MAG: serine/threonine-protein kinase [Mariniblastus sp.]
MKTEQHVSDADLRQIVLEKETQWPQSKIETHVSSCVQCQSKMLDIAADHDWRDEFSSNLKELPSLSNHDQITSAFRGPNAADIQADVSGDEFDLQTVDQMLDEVLQPPIHPEMLGRLGRYDIEGVIGCGGMGVVLRGFDRDLHRPVAIKMILPRLSKNGTAKQRFAREARAAAAVLHPNVISIHGIEESDGIPWFVMPLIAGPSLKLLVEENGPLPERDIVRIGLQIASGLAAAHSQGLVHRDIKPENILVDNQINRVVITDFGLAQRDTDVAMTQTGYLAGTISYMSPEQSRGDDVDARSDLFSLGSLLFYLATGEVPFRASSPIGILHKIGGEPHANVQSLNPEISITLTRVINRLLEKSPSDRFQSAVELEAFSTEFLAHLHQPAQTPAPTVPLPKKQKPGQSLTGWNQFGFAGTAAILAIISALILVGVFLGKQFWPKEPSRKPPPLTQRLTWAEVSEKHGLSSQEEFETELRSLNAMFLEAESSFQTTQDMPGPTALNEQINQFSRELEQLNSALPQ